MTPAKLEPDGQGMTSRTLSASSWQLGAAGIHLVARIVILAVLSRLLPPVDFGVVGAALICVTFFRLYSDLGLGAALIQRPRLAPAHVRAAVTLSVAGGMVMCLAMWWSAPWLARLMGSVESAALFRLMSAALAINSFTTVSNALLWRDLRVKEASVADIGGYVAGYGLVGIPLAWGGAGPWALAWATLAQGAVRTALLYFYARHPLRPGLARGPMRELIRFGFGMSLARLFDFLAARGDYVIVARWLGLEALGFYERAYRLMDSTSNMLAGIADKILFSAMAQLQDEDERLRRAFLDGTTLTLLVYLPLGALFSISAVDLVVTLFGEDWAAAGQPFRILAIALVFRAASRICESLIHAKGAVYRSAWRMCLYAGAVLLGAWLGSSRGIPAVAAGVGAAIVLRHAALTHLSLRLIDLGPGDLARRYLPGLWIAGAIWALVVPLRQLAMSGWPPWMALLGVLAATGVVGIGALVTLPASWAGDDARRLIQRLGTQLPFGKVLVKIGEVGGRV